MAGALRLFVVQWQVSNTYGLWQCVALVAIVNNAPCFLAPLVVNGPSVVFSKNLTLF